MPFGLLVFFRFWWLFQHSTFLDDRMWYSVIFGSRVEGILPGGRFHNSMAFHKICVDFVFPVSFWSLLWPPGAAWSPLGDGNGVGVGVQNVPTWGFEIADSRAVWHLCGTVAELAKHMNPKRPIAESSRI